MNYISLLFFVFLGILFLFYYVLPKRMQWPLLLIGSLVFYAFASYLALPVLVLEILVTYVLARRMEKSRRKKGFMAAILLMHLLMLLLLMYVPAWIPGFLGEGVFSKLIAPLGISYFTLIMIGYGIDVYREEIPAEKNFAKLVLFGLFFPSITQGPLNRYPDLSAQFAKEHAFDSKKIFHGLVRFGFGAFKKMVVANRVAAYIAAVHANEKAAGVFVLLGILLFFLQLYADFSGCMDIVLGVSEMFGIELPENFRQPFFSRSVAEFWRRWHITLGNWLQNYLYYPVSMCPAAKKFIKNGPGKKKSRIRIVSCVSFFLLWMCMAVWHGPQIGFVFLGVQYAIVFIVTFLLGPVSKRFAAKHPKLEANGFWKFFQRVRTVALIWPVFLFAPTMEELHSSLRQIVTKFQPEKLFQGGLFRFDLDPVQWILLLIGFLTILIVSNIEVRKDAKIIDLVLAQKLPVRILIYWFALIMILLSLSIQNTEFIYAQY